MPSEDERAPGSFSVLSPSLGKSRGVCHPLLTSAPSLEQTHSFHFQQDSSVSSTPLLSVKTWSLLIFAKVLETNYIAVNTQRKRLLVMETNTSRQWVSRQVADHQRCKEQSDDLPLGHACHSRRAFFGGSRSWLTDRVLLGAGNACSAATHLEAGVFVISKQLK